MFFTHNFIAEPAAYIHNQRPHGQRFPLVNAKEDEQNIVLEVIAPGRKKENFKIELKDNLLTISSEAIETEKSENYRFTEFKLVPFSRTFRLVSEVEVEQIQANYVDGILYVSLPKKVQEPARLIEVK
ncbi:MAG: Hsp20/alpha crystallin family protein [Microscillaceae bacterium]|jgi:HSP20 family protein|nr:Hsp20/alpha crystallin family protein [Microscillaceae bacterium]